MRKLISRFSQSGGLLVFLILEAICLGLIVNFNKEQREIYRNSKSIASDTITGKVNEWKQYWNLTAVNDSLAGVNADLLAQQDEAKFQNSIWRDSFREKKGELIQQYTYTAAKVVDNTVTLPDNYLILDKGTDHGINDQTGVFDDRGVVGIVVGSNPKYSRVMSILHRDSKISAEIKGKGAFGSIQWESTANPTQVKLKYIFNHLSPEIGDTIVTSGFSSHFPQGRTIGTIKDIKEDKKGSSHYDITVQLTNDLSTTRYVYVVNNLFKEDFLEMKEGKKNE